MASPGPEHLASKFGSEMQRDLRGMRIYGDKVTKVTSLPFQSFLVQDTILGQAGQTICREMPSQ